MKKAKRLLAILLGAIMVMGCLSVSAANSALSVTEEVPFYGYSDDFTAETMSGHVVLGTNTEYDSANGVIKSTGSGAKANIYLNQDQSSVTGTVVMEYNIKMPGGHGAWASNAQMQMYFYGSGQSDQIIDMRWVAGLSTNSSRPSIYELVNVDTPATLSWGEENISFKVVFYSATETMDLWVNGTQILTGATPRFPHDNLTRVEFSTSGNIPFQVDDFKWYTLPVAAEGMPIPGEVLYHEDFEANVATPASTSRITLSSDITYTQTSGKLAMSTSKTGGKNTNIALTTDGSKMTGKYVVEFTLTNPSGTENAHRLNLGAGDTFYIGWNPSTNYLGTRNFNDEGIVDRSTERATFGADGTKLKVTAMYDTDAGTQKIWLNDTLFYEKTYAESKKAAGTSIASVYIVLYRGTLDIEDFRVYRPATFDATTGLSITEDANNLKIATNAAKAGRLYFATYEGEEDAKTVSALGTAALNMTPGMVYTISKADWAGAKAFFWDANLQPIVNAWDLQ